MARRGKSLTDQEVRQICSAYASPGAPEYWVENLAVKLGRSKRTIQRYGRVLRVIERHGVRGPLTDEKWRDVSKDQDIAFDDVLTQRFVENLARAYTSWREQARETQAVEDEVSVDVPAHIGAILQAARRLADAIVLVPSPSEELVQWLEGAMPPGRALPPGCVDPELLPPGRYHNEPAFGWLWQHTKDHAIWMSIQDWSDAWWSYLSRLVNLAARIQEHAQRTVGIFVPREFAVSILREAFAAHLGSPSDADKEMRSYAVTGMSGSPFYCVDWGGVPVGRGTAEQANAIADEHHALRRRVIGSRDCHEIAEEYRALQRQAKNFAEWLRSLNPDGLSLGTCATCEAERSYLYQALKGPR
ncbi:MAG: hypothetical protein Q8P50_08925 [Bacillota bacterium]|nr:hypothetical protein [Bacillota bacterium]